MSTKLPDNWERIEASRLAGKPLEDAENFAVLFWAEVKARQAVAIARREGMSDLTMFHFCTECLCGLYIGVYSGLMERVPPPFTKQEVWHVLRDLGLDELSGYDMLRGIMFCSIKLRNTMKMEQNGSPT